MATGYTRQASANIASGLPIQSADINNELNQVQSAFNISTGHDHSGSSAGTGAKIVLTTGVSSILPVANGGTNNSTAYTTGSVIYSDGTKLTQDNANLFWDATNKRLAIGAASAAYTLDVTGPINTSTVYRIAGVQLARRASGYNVINDTAGNDSIVLGQNSDPGNYHNQTSHTFRSINLSTIFATMQATGCTMLGTNTNDNAAASNVGEYIEADAAAASVSLTTGTPTNITSISLTAGDWNVWGNVTYNPATGAPTQIKGWISTTSATDPGANNSGAFVNLNCTFSLNNQSIPVGLRRISLSGTTTVYLSGLAAFPNTCTGGGHIAARRVR